MLKSQASGARDYERARFRYANWLLDSDRAFWNLAISRPNLPERVIGNWCLGNCPQCRSEAKASLVAGEETEANEAVQSGLQQARTRAK